MRSVTVVLLLLVYLLGFGENAQAFPKDGEPIVIGKTYQFNSEVLNDVREINVWMPPQRDQGEEKFKVIYLLDGGLQQDFQHIAGLGQLGALSWTYERLIIVGVETKNRQAELTHKPSDQRYQTEFPEAGEADRFRSFLKTEVIPFVEANFAAADHRALIGESLAGLFVVDTFLHEPELFSDYIAISPSLWWDDRALSKTATTLLQQHKQSEQRLYLTIADEGGTMQDGMDRLVAALKSSQISKDHWIFKDRSKTETHTTIYHAAALDAFRWLYANPPYDYGPTPWYLKDSSEP